MARKDPRSRSRNDGPDDQRSRVERESARRLRADEARNGGHAFCRHVDVSRADTYRRASVEYSTRDGRGRNHPTNATRWTNERALARAVDRVERSQQYIDRSQAKARQLSRGDAPETVRFSVRLPLAQALGPRWHQEVEGHTADGTGVRRARFNPSSEVVAVFRATTATGGWTLHTCYPTTGVQP